MIQGIDEAAQRDLKVIFVDEAVFTFNTALQCLKNPFR
jgi:hypothetical protein